MTYTAEKRLWTFARPTGMRFADGHFRSVINARRSNGAGDAGQR